MPKPLGHISSLKHLIELKLEAAAGSGGGKGGEDGARFACPISGQASGFGGGRGGGPGWAHLAASGSLLPTCPCWLYASLDLQQEPCADACLRAAARVNTRRPSMQREVQVQFVHIRRVHAMLVQLVLSNTTPLQMAAGLQWQVQICHLPQERPRAERARAQGGERAARVLCLLLLAALPAVCVCSFACLLELFVSSQC